MKKVYFIISLNMPPYDVSLHYNNFPTSNIFPSGVLTNMNIVCDIASDKVCISR